MKDDKLEVRSKTVESIPTTLPGNVNFPTSAPISSFPSIWMDILNTIAAICWGL
ncbi:MAG: hypothetical protein ACR2KZ_15695 [Segetibacter sp.]